MKPPVAQKIPTRLHTAGQSRIDHYFWLKERDNPRVREYLEAENAYTQAVMKDTEELQEQLFKEITSRIRQKDSTVPYLHNGYFYYARFEEGGEYPVYCRKKDAPDAEEAILIDGNALSEGHAYFEADSYEISPDNRLMAYCVDTVGNHLYTVFFKNLETDTLLPAVITGASDDIAWAGDSQTLFYCLKNEETLRSEQVLKYHPGSGVSTLLYTERDETFDVTVFREKSETLIFMVTANNTTVEYRYLHADRPGDRFKVFQPRRKNMEYYLYHHNGRFYIITNYRAKNFRLMETDAEHPGREHWKELTAHRNDVLLEDVELFDDFMVLSERKNGLVRFRVISRDGSGDHYIDFPEEAYTAELSDNPSFDTRLLRVEYNSPATPDLVFDYDMLTREKTTLKQQEIVGGYRPEDYITRRLYAAASDGTEIPITMVYRKDTPIDGHAPLLLYGYGAYGINIDPNFSISRISLLDRGFIHALAHVRGSQYLGREWYEKGKMLYKRNTFTDFIACAEHLIGERYTDAGHLFAMGGSAGGLLVGAALNMRPDLFCGVIANVPFVDVITTMDDKSIPLTAGEYEEWGNPQEEPYYRYMMSYSPYDNVAARDYPHIMVTAGLHDAQVQYWEPAKWVAKLREMKTDNHLLLLHTNMEAGHGGASGRFEHYREIALEYAFLMKILKINHH
jgi:oligopeptidase B